MCLAYKRRHPFYFHRCTTAKDGYQNTCKPCKAAHQREHAEAHLASSRASYARHLDQERARTRAYHRAHPEKAYARNQQYRRTHRAVLAQRRRTAYWGNPDKERQARRIAYASNPAKSIAAVTAWVKAHLSQKYAANHARRVLTRYSVNGEKVDLDMLYARDKGICQLCQKPVRRKDASRDHVIPLSKGGEHSYKNCVLAHLRCNASKGNRPIPQQQRLFG
jgi:hypothetical protein